MRTHTQTVFYCFLFQLITSIGSISDFHPGYAKAAKHIFQVFIIASSIIFFLEHVGPSVQIFNIFIASI